MRRVRDIAESTAQFFGIGIQQKKTATMGEAFCITIRQWRCKETCQAYGA
jgi:hypothetical protein